MIEAAGIRLRPIIMTSIAAACGSLPLILAGRAPARAAAQTIGVVIFAGAIFATLLTLFVVPVFYNLLARVHEVAGMDRPADRRVRVARAVAPAAGPDIRARPGGRGIVSKASARRAGWRCRR